MCDWMVCVSVNKHNSHRTCAKRMVNATRMLVHMHASDMYVHKWIFLFMEIFIGVSCDGFIEFLRKTYIRTMWCVCVCVCVYIYISSLFLCVFVVVCVRVLHHAIYVYTRMQYMHAFQYMHVCCCLGMSCMYMCMHASYAYCTCFWHDVTHVICACTYPFIS